MVRLFRHYVPRFILVIGTLESGILFGSFYLGLAYQSSQGGAIEYGLFQLFREASLYTLAMIVVLAAMGLYDRGLRDQLADVFMRVALGFTVGMLAMLGLMVVWADMIIAGNVLFTVLATCAVGVLLVRAVFHEVADRPVFKQRILVLGAGRPAMDLERLRRRSDWRGVLLVGYLAWSGEQPCVSGNKVLSSKGSLLETVKDYRIGRIVVALDEITESAALAELLACKMSGIEVEGLATFLERRTGKLKLDALCTSAVVFADGFVQALHRGGMHRVFDVFVSVVILLLALPIMMVTAVAILVESGLRGPVLYRQLRIGRRGQTFRILKFRSMQVDAEHDGKPLWAVRNDRRVTRVGAFIRRTRIDELPQLLNVLKGDMSFVGPRPERPEFVEQLSQRIPYYYLRHAVNPGLTGWAQIRYPYSSSEDAAEEKLQYDLYYVKNYSIFLDLTILLQTVQVVLWGKGAR